MDNILWILIAVFVILILYFVQNNIIFTQYGTIVDISHYNIPIEEVMYPSHDRKKLHALYIKHENPLGIIVFFHGNANTVFEWAQFGKRFYELGYSVFMVEYRGYGKCPGTPTEDLTYKDAMSAYKYVTNHLNYSDDKIILSGVSLGGAVCINLATKVNVAAVIIDSSFTSMPDMANEFIPYVGRYLCKFSFDSVNLIKKVKAPCLIMHSRSDKLVPFEMAEELYKNAPFATTI